MNWQSLKNKSSIFCISLQKHFCKNSRYVAKTYFEQCTEILIYTFKFSPTDCFTSKIISNTCMTADHAWQLENVLSCYVQRTISYCDKNN